MSGGVQNAIPACLPSSLWLAATQSITDMEERETTPDRSAGCCRAREDHSCSCSMGVSGGRAQIPLQAPRTAAAAALHTCAETPCINQMLTHTTVMVQDSK